LHLRRNLVVKALPVPVSPAVLRWARESAGIDLKDAARRVVRDASVLERWESGEVRPTLRALETLAAIYRRPLAALFLSEPPADPPLPNDFRVLPRAPPSGRCPNRTRDRARRGSPPITPGKGAVQESR
jgi:transcriptional regulator with XRE-family HTH domain